MKKASTDKSQRRHVAQNEDMGDSLNRTAYSVPEPTAALELGRWHSGHSVFMDAEFSNIEPTDTEGQRYHGYLEYPQILLSILEPIPLHIPRDHYPKRHRGEFHSRCGDETRGLLCSAFPLNPAIRREIMFSQTSTCVLVPFLYHPDPTILFLPPCSLNRTADSEWASILYQQPETTAGHLARIGHTWPLLSGWWVDKMNKILN